MRKLVGFAYDAAEQVSFILFVKRYILNILLAYFLCVVHPW